MPYMTVTGLRVVYPYALASRLLSLTMGRGQMHDIAAEIIEETRKTFDELQRVSARCGELEAEVSRLRHENEFMTRLLTEQMQEGKEGGR